LVKGARHFLLKLRNKLELILILKMSVTDCLISCIVLTKSTLGATISFSHTASLARLEV